MKYTKLTCRIEPVNEINREIVIAELGTLDFESFVETDTGIEAYIPSCTLDQKAIGQLAFNNNPLFTVETTAEEMPDKNWNEEWEKNYFKPLLVANKCVVRAPFHHEYPKAEYEIIIEPKMAFGTGNHETTSLVIELILNMELKGKRVLDMGCGTGILGILAAMKGAAEVTAIDIDQWAYENTLENAKINNIKNITVHQGDATLLNNQQFDAIFANIQKNVLLADMETYLQVLTPNGTLILSGFYENDIPDIKAKAESLGFKEACCLSRNRWVAYQVSNEQ